MRGQGRGEWLLAGGLKVDAGGVGENESRVERQDERPRHKRDKRVYASSLAAAAARRASLERGSDGGRSAGVVVVAAARANEGRHGDSLDAIDALVDSAIGVVAVHEEDVAWVSVGKAASEDLGAVLEGVLVSLDRSAASLDHVVGRRGLLLEAVGVADKGARSRLRVGAVALGNLLEIGDGGDEAPAVRLASEEAIELVVVDVGLFRRSVGASDDCGARWGP